MCDWFVGFFKIIDLNKIKKLNVEFLEDRPHIAFGPSYPCPIIKVRFKGEEGALPLSRQDLATKVREREVRYKSLLNLSVSIEEIGRIKGWGNTIFYKVTDKAVQKATILATVKRP